MNFTAAGVSIIVEAPDRRARGLLESLGLPAEPAGELPARDLLDRCHLLRRLLPAAQRSATSSIGTTTHHALNCLCVAHWIEYLDSQTAALIRLAEAARARSADTVIKWGPPCSSL